MNAPSPSAQSPALALQARLFDFAIAELIHQHRDSFAPAWTVESWAKLMIWLALNCGCSGERDALEAFAAALGPALTARLRRQFFSRQLDDLGLRLLADPAEAQALAFQLDPALPVDRPRLRQALERVGLLAELDEEDTWQDGDGLTLLPWRHGGGPRQETAPCS
ncbi:MAG: protein phosphatase [Synechococcaceae cyanobacterium]|nr:protein phosphatase [Synechococcaceae cyanobacterium]